MPVNDVAKTLNYYDEILGYRIEGRYDDIFGSVLRGKANIYFRKFDGQIAPSQCYVCVDEVDELCRHFKASGAWIIENPKISRGIVAGLTVLAKVT